jgi:hypothetical protein
LTRGVLTGRALAALSCAALLAVGACSSDSHGIAQTADVGSGSASPTTAGPPAKSSSDGTVLKAPAGTDAATIAAAAEVVRGRLTRMGVTNAGVSPTSDGVAVRSSADGYQLHGAAQRHATTVAPVTGTTVGTCNGRGTQSVAPARRCYTLGNALTGVTAITDASVQSTSGTGWKVTFSIASDQYRTFRAALEPAAAPELAVVTDDSSLRSWRVSQG